MKLFRVETQRLFYNNFFGNTTIHCEFEIINSTLNLFFKSI